MTKADFVTEILFENNKFSRCNFKCSSIYDLEDWEFINKLSNFILELVREKQNAKKD